MVRVKGLKVIREFDPWGSKLCTCPHKFTLNPYTGCSHHCLYCYARSYIPGFDRPRPKKDLLRRVRHDAAILPRGSLISIAESSDPYTPPERVLGLTREVLKILIGAGHRVLVVTKSDLVTRDADILKGGAAVAITITTLDDEVSAKIEPGAPPPSKRIRAVEELSRRGVPVSVRIDPIIPYINDDPTMLGRLVKEVADAGALQVITSTYKARWDSLARFRRAVPEVGEALTGLYRGLGERVGGYLYLPRKVRIRMLMPVWRAAIKHGLAFSTCREGMSVLNTPGVYCDGSTWAYLTGGSTDVAGLLKFIRGRTSPEPIHGNKEGKAHSGEYVG